MHAAPPLLKKELYKFGVHACTGFHSATNKLIVTGEHCIYNEGYIVATFALMHAYTRSAPTAILKMNIGYIYKFGVHTEQRQLKMQLQYNNNRMHACDRRATANADIYSGNFCV